MKQGTEGILRCLEHTRKTAGRLVSWLSGRGRGSAYLPLNDYASLSFLSPPANCEPLVQVNINLGKHWLIIPFLESQKPMRPPARLREFEY
jgi:hypothetical protein